MRAKTERDAGFTTMEVVVAMALTAIVGGALLSGVSGSLALVDKARRRAASSIALLKTDDALRAAVAQVRIPYWERSARAVRDGDDLLLPWFQGVKGRKLRVGVREGRLFMEAGGTLTRFDGIEDPEIRALPSAGSPAALEISYTVEDRAVRLLAPFGARPLGAGAFGAGRPGGGASRGGASRGGAPRGGE